MRGKVNIIRRSALGLAVTAAATFGMIGVSSASATASVCPIHGCTEILVTAYGPTQSQAFLNALALVKDEGCGTAGSGGSGELSDGTWWAKEYGFCP
jgi:hypothetical protein